MVRGSIWLHGLGDALQRHRSDGGVAVVAALLGIGLRGMLDPLLEWREPYLTGIAMVAVVGLKRGTFAAVLTAAFGTVLATLLFVVPRGSLALSWPAAAGAVAAALVCVVVIAAARRVRERADRLAGDNKALALQLEEHDRFLARASHELRSPLGAVRWAVVLLQAQGARPDEAAVDRAVGILQRQMRQLCRMVDDLVALCGSALGGLNVDRQETDLRSCVEAAIEANQLNLRAKQQRLQLALPRDAVPVLVDAGRVAQAISNVLHNASKFSPAGTAIDIALLEEGPLVHLEVRDGGPGFGRTEAAHKGLGIGLQLSRTLMELHGGGLFVEEHDGPGAIVRLTLPRLQAHAVERMAVRSPGVAVMESGVDHDQCRPRMAS